MPWKSLDKSYNFISSRNRLFKDKFYDTEQPTILTPRKRQAQMQPCIVTYFLSNSACFLVIVLHKKKKKK